MGKDGPLPFCRGGAGAVRPIGLTRSQDWGTKTGHQADCKQSVSTSFRRFFSGILSFWCIKRQSRVPEVGAWGDAEFGKICSTNLAFE